MEEQGKFLLQDGLFTIERKRGISPEVRHFLDQINWGSAGAVYEHKNTPEHIQHIADPVLLLLKQENELLGTAVFCHTRVYHAASSFNCYYVRYFAASPEAKGKGIIKKYAVQVMEGIRTSEKERTVYFASIEAGNKASYAVVQQAGYVPVATVKTLGFSRFFPQLNSSVQRISSDAERSEIQELLNRFYQIHHLVRFDQLFLKDQYLYIREKGEIIAGCQYHRAHWVVKQMPGIKGKLITSILPHLPMIRTLFHPKRFEFLGFEAIFYKEGREDALAQLFEHALASEKLHSAMFWMDEKCPYYQMLEKKLSKGLIHFFVKNSDIKMMASWSGLDEPEVQGLHNSPVYASAFDHI